METILELTKKYEAEMIANRRHIHENPELGGNEHKTVQFVAEKLREMGLEPKTDYSERACTAVLAGKPGGKVIMLRADMDALPITEETGLPFASHEPGTMHACGHDCHTAALLGAARILCDKKESLQGSVKFCFQPAEEVKGRGACVMVEDGVLEQPKVDFVMGIHLTPSLPFGYLCCEAGPATAYPDFFTLKFYGKSCHGSAPSTGKDPIRAAVLAYHMINDLSARIDVLEPHVIQVCSINAGTTTNIIPETASLGGTIRTVTPKSRQLCIEAVENICHTIEANYGIRCELTGFGPATPPVVNDPDYTPKAKASAAKIISGGFVAYNADQLGGEDFSFFQSTGIPGFFIRSGCSNEDPSTKYPLHSNKFCPDERVISQNAAIYAQVAMDYLDQADK